MMYIIGCELFVCFSFFFLSHVRRREFYELAGMKRSREEEGLEWSIILSKGIQVILFYLTTHVLSKKNLSIIIS